MSIILEIPLTYTASVIPVGCNMPRDVGVACTHVMSFPEMTADQVPVAARLDLTGAEEFASLGAIRHPLDYRRNPHGGLLLLAEHINACKDSTVLAGHCGAHDIGTALAEASRANLRFSPFLESPTHEQWLREGERVRRTLGTDRNARLAQLRAAMTGGCFIDGQFLAPDSGPMFYIQSNYRQGRRHDVVAYPRYSPHATHYRADRLVDALAFARLLNADAGIAAEPVVHGRIDVIDPTAFAVDDDWLALSHHVSSYLKTTGPGLHLREERAARAWFALRDRHRQGWPSDYDAGLHALFETERAHTNLLPSSYALRSLARVEQTQRRLALYGGLELAQGGHPEPAAGPGGP